MARRFRRRFRRKRRSRRSTRGKHRTARYSHERVAYFKCTFPYYGTGGAYSASNLTSPTTTGGTTTQENNFSFKLGQIPYFARITNLYDMYKLTKVVLDFIPVGDTENPYPNAVSYSATTTAIPTIITAIDHNDSGAVGVAIYSYAYCKETLCSRRFRRTIYPRVAKAVFGNGAFTSYANEKPGWIDAAYVNVEHYGLRIYFPTIQNLNGPTHAYRVIATFYVQAREFRAV